MLRVLQIYLELYPKYLQTNQTQEILLIYPNLNIVTKEVFDQIDMNKIQNDPNVVEVYLGE